MMIAIDCETTGLDLRHGARPFFVTTFSDSGPPELRQKFWEWPVNPVTRQPAVDEEQVAEIQALLDSADRVITQNGKFDALALTQIGISWPWEKNYDTLLASHLLYTNLPHNLTALASQYLGVDIKPYEETLRQTCLKVRGIVRRKYPSWRTASEGEPDMPSLKSGSKGKVVRGAQGEEPWRADMWLPAALAHELVEPLPREGCRHKWENDTCRHCGGHHWHWVLREYSNIDSEVTLMLWPVLERKVREKGYWKVFEMRRRVARVGPRIEGHGVCMNLQSYDTLQTQYRADSERLGNLCKELVDDREIPCPECTLPPKPGKKPKAPPKPKKTRKKDTPLDPHLPPPPQCAICQDTKVVNFKLEFPKGAANNKSVVRCFFDVLKLPVVGLTDSGNPSLDKDAMTIYQATLGKNSKQGIFVKSFLDRRSRQTFLTYMEGYRRFALPLEHTVRTGHCGSTDRDCRCMICDGNLSVCTACGEREAGLDGPCLPNQWMRLYPNLNPTGTDTLRWSHSNPNSANIGNKGIDATCDKCLGSGEYQGSKCGRCKGEGTLAFNLRYLFGPAPGRELWSLDFQNVELRIPAYRSGEKSLIELFERPNDPPFYGSQHMLNFSVVYPDVWADVIKKVGVDKAGPYCKKELKDSWYYWVKRGDFAIQYQCGRETADRAFSRPGSYDKLKSRFAALEKLNQQCIRHAEQYGYVETIPDKTVDPNRGFPVQCTRTGRGGVLTTVPLSYFVQSTAMWLTGMAMVRCQDKLDQWQQRDGFDGYMALQVHDELVFDLPKAAHPKEDREYEKEHGKLPPFRTSQSSNLWRVRILQRLMEMGGEGISVPTPVGVTFHDENWSDGYTV